MTTRYSNGPRADAGRSGLISRSRARSVSKQGLSWRVVESKWEDLRRAFHGFDPEKVARMTPRAVDKLLDDERVIRSRGKIEATIENAEMMLELDEECGGFRRYLRSHHDFESRAKDLRERFKYLGDHGAYRFLWTVGEEVPSYEEWSKSRGLERPGRTARQQ
jgi:3-methyladenine DNA glycosylase Tag